MAYRDDLTAARARIEALEHALDDERRRAEAAEQRADQAERRAREARREDAAPARARDPRRWRGIVYQRPRSYLPLFRLLGAALRVGVPRFAEPESNGLIAWLGYWLAQPLRYVVVAPLLFGVIYPYTALFSLATAPLLALYLMVRGLRLGGVGGRAPTEPLLDTDADSPVFAVVTLAVATAGGLSPLWILLLS